MKKIFAMAAFVLGILILQTPQADAREIFVGTYSDGTTGYFVEEGFETLGNNFFKCYVKVVDGNTVKGYRPYFIKGAGGWMYAHKVDAAPLQWRPTSKDSIADKCKSYCIQMSTYGSVYQQ